MAARTINDKGLDGEHQTVNDNLLYGTGSGGSGGSGGDVSALTGRVSDLEVSQNTQNTELTALAQEDTTQATRLDVLEANQVTAYDDSGLVTRLDSLESGETTQNQRLTTVESTDVSQNTRLDALEAAPGGVYDDTAVVGRLDAIEGEQTTQNTRLTTGESSDAAQNTRLDTLEANQVTAYDDTAVVGRLDALETSDTTQSSDIAAQSIAIADHSGRITTLEGASGGGGGELPALPDSDGPFVVQNLSDLGGGRIATWSDLSNHATGGGSYYPTINIDDLALGALINDSTKVVQITGVALDLIASVTATSQTDASTVPISLSNTTFNTADLTIVTSSTEHVYDVVFTTTDSQVVTFTSAFTVVSSLIPGNTTPWYEATTSAVTSTGAIHGTIANQGALFSDIAANEDFKVTFDPFPSDASSISSVGINGAATFGSTLYSDFLISVYTFSGTTARLYTGSIQRDTAAILITDTLVLKRTGTVYTVHVETDTNPAIMTYDAGVADAGYFKVLAATGGAANGVSDLELVKL